jgi:hypothetical protein
MRHVHSSFLFHLSGQRAKLTLSTTTEFNLDFLVHVLVQIQNILLLRTRCFRIVVVVRLVVVVGATTVASSSSAVSSSVSSSVAASELTAF